MSRKMRAYELYEGDKYILTGTYEEIACRLNVSMATVYSIASKGHKRYRMVHIGDYEPVYALYAYDAFIETGTVSKLAEIVGIEARSLYTRQFDTKNNTRYKHVIYKLEGESELVKKIQYKQSMYEVIRDYKSYVGTPEEIAEQMDVGVRYAASKGKLVGYRYAKLKVVDTDTLETLYGTVEEVADHIGLTEMHIKRVIRGTRATSRYTFTDTGQSIVKLLNEDKPGVTKPKSEYMSVKPVYVSERQPMSEYGKQLLENTFRKWA